MIKVGVVGAGGYAGVNLVQILLRHPKTDISWIMSEPADKGKKITELYPFLNGMIDQKFDVLENLDQLLPKVDVVFLALPHGIAMNHVPAILKAGKKVIDLGADYRFFDLSVWKKWYGTDHGTPDLLKQNVFGLPEFYAKEIKKAQLVGSPGCYPTASILGAAPLVKEGLVDLDAIIVDAKSGVSGAGRGANSKTHYCERNEAMQAYNVTGHRHMGEIEYHLGLLGKKDAKVTFVPHLAPMTRGILATIYLKAKSSKVKVDELINLYKKTYKDARFVRILEDTTPSTKYVAGTNYCDIGVHYNAGTGQIIVLSAIDNLVKGAAGQAVQNMNIMYDFEEDAGLEHIGVFP